MSIKWTKAPTRTLWGDTMVVADIEIDADHTLTLYCELDQAYKVNAMLDGRDKARMALAEREFELAAVTGLVSKQEDLERLLAERDAEIERLNLLYQAISYDADMFRQQVAEQRKVLEQANKALKQCRAVIQNAGSNLQDVGSSNPYFLFEIDAAITAIQGVLK